MILFGSGGPTTLAARAALQEVADVVAVVAPGPGPVRGPRGVARALLRRLAAHPLARADGRLFWYERGQAQELAARLRPFAPDLLCAAAFPFRLPGSLLGLPSRGAINVHGSLLPRHRGPAPLFWAYAADDPETGVTVHWMADAVDAGDILYQESIALDRGRPMTDLHAELARRGAALLARAVTAVAESRAPRVPQDVTQATHEADPRRDGWRIDTETWGAERVWHVLAGVGGRYGPLLRERSGRAVPHGAALRFELSTHGRAAGLVERTREGWRVYCRDGTVDVPRAGLAARLRAWTRPSRRHTS